MKVFLQRLPVHSPVIAIGMRLNHDEVTHKIGSGLGDEQRRVPAHGLAHESHLFVGKALNVGNDVVDERPSREIVGNARRASVTALINEQDAVDR